jgi:hypothetical protein
MNKFNDLMQEMIFLIDDITNKLLEMRALTDAQMNREKVHFV